MTARHAASCRPRAIAWAAATGLLVAANAARAATEDAVPEAFRDAPAVVLSDATDINGSEYPLRTRHRVRLKILSRKGFTHANQVVWYEGHSEDLKDFAARTIRPNGTVVDVPRDLCHDVIAWKNDKLEYHALYFTFPAVEEGVVLEWSYAVASSSLRDLQRWNVQRSIPVLEARFAWTGPAGSIPLTMSFSSRGPAKLYCSDLQSPQQGFTCRDVPPYDEEQSAPPPQDRLVDGYVAFGRLGQVSPAARIKEALNAEWSKRLDRCVRKSDAVTARAQALVAGAVNEDERIDRIFKFVVENIVVRSESEDEDLFTGDRRCTRADDVLSNGGGTSDDVTLLTFALLRDAGVPAHVVLMADRSNGRFKADLPDWTQYRHALVEVGTGTRLGYLDPSCKYCSAGAPDWRYCGEGSGGLRVLRDEQMPTLLTLNGVDPKVNAQIISDNVAIAADGRANVTRQVSWGRQVDVSIRRRLKELTPAGREQEILGQIKGDIENPKVTIGDPESVRDTMRVNLEFTQHDLAVSAGDVMFVRPPDTFSPALDLPIQETRTLPVWWPYARSVWSLTSITLPEGTSVRSLPGDVRLDGPGLLFEGAWARGASDTEVSWRARLTVSRSSLRPEEYPAAREFAAKLRDAMRRGLVLEGRHPAAQNHP